MKYLILLFVLVSCAGTSHKEPKNPIFPYGTYHHNISVDVPAKDLHFNFTGVNQWSEERFIVVGLGPMDMTVIKYEEDRLNYTKDLYLNKELLPIDDKRAMQLMSLMRDMVTWERSICENKKCHDTFWGVPIDIRLNEQDQPDLIQINYGGVAVDVEVSQ